MEILHVKDLGDTSVISECSLGVNLVIDNFFDVATDTWPLYKIWKQQTITYGDIVFQRFGGYKCHQWVQFGC